MNRTKFYNTSMVDGIKEVDHLYNTLSSFTLNHSPTYYRVNESEIDQPDFISKKMYNTERYWWIICLVNGIKNPFSDLQAGDIIKIPSILDIYDFYQKYNIR